MKKVIIGCRVPRKFFLTSGVGESELDFHTGSFHQALLQAGIEKYNVMIYSSILPAGAEEVPLPKTYQHGAVLETITARSDATKRQRATAGLAYGWFIDRNTGKKIGGAVCEYSNHGTTEEAEKELRDRLDEIYLSGFSEKCELTDVTVKAVSFVPKKKFGTAVVVIGFLDYVVPILEE